MGPDCGKLTKCWWVSADRDPRFFGKLLYESEQWAGRDPTVQVGCLALLFSSNSGSGCHTTVSCYLKRTFLTFHPFGRSVPYLSTLTLFLHRWPNDSRLKVFPIIRLQIF